MLELCLSLQRSHRLQSRPSELVQPRERPFHLLPLKTKSGLVKITATGCLGSLARPMPV
jgi:hypothetical protein